MNDRVTELEIKVAYLERTVETLDEVVRKLNDSMGAVTREVKRLRVKEAQEQGTPPANEKPPHY